MSNDVTNTPLLIDTAAAAPITLKRLDILFIRWCAPAASAGDACAIKTAAGRSLWFSTATGANYIESEHWPEASPLIADGLTVLTLATGTLYIGVKNFTGVS